MRLCFGLAFVCVVIAILVFFKIDGMAINDAVKTVQGKKKTLKKLSEKQKESKAAKFIKNIIFALDTMGQINHFYYILLISFLMIIVGAFAGISFGSVWLAITFSIILASIPFIYVRVQYIEYKALLLDEMETGLSIITSSIERTENIEESIRENLDNLNQPLKKVFEIFLFSIQHSKPVADSIDDMKQKINNTIFMDWCDALKNVDRDRTLKTSLRPIVDRITSVKVAIGEAKNILHEANGEFKAVMVLSILFMVLSYWFLPWMLGGLGIQLQMGAVTNVLLAIDILILFVFAIRTFTLTRDVNFDDV